MLQIRLNVFLVKEPYFPKQLVVPSFFQTTVEQVESVCTKGHGESNSRMYCSLLISAFCEFITQKFKPLVFKPTFDCRMWTRSIDYCLEFQFSSLYFFLHIFLVFFVFCFFFLVTSFNFLHEVIRKIFRFILMTPTWLMMLSDFKIEARLVERP